MVGIFFVPLIFSSAISHAVSYYLYAFEMCLQEMIPYLLVLKMRLQRLIFVMPLICREKVSYASRAIYLVNMCQERINLSSQSK